MLDSIAHIATALAEARKKKGLSQRALSLKTGLTQSHISKIENGEINLQTSSLIQVARALELELMLIPREMIITVESLLHHTGVKSLKQTPMYSLEDSLEDDDV